MSSATSKRAEAEALFFAGNRQLAAGDTRGAETCFRAALEHVPDFAEAHANLAYLLERAGALPAAEEHYRASIAADAGIAQTHLNLGALLAEQKRFAEAEAAYRRALDLQYDSAPAWSNLGALQAGLRQDDAAEASFRLAMRLDPDYAPARFNLGYLLLRQGRYSEGWSCFEARDWYAALDALLDCPRWQGDSLAGRSILIGIEAGLGDMIQFCRYAALLKEKGAGRIGLLCHPGLSTLLASLAGIDAVIAADGEIPRAGWDCWVPLLSLPFHCRTRIDTIPAGLPYLAADRGRVEAWRVKLAEAATGRLKVGLVWRGNPRFENDADRSLPALAMLAPLGKVAGACFFSLQKGVGEDEAAQPPPELSLIDLAPAISDFSDTAAIVANLDLVISVDTAVAHLAGALGKRCWILLPDYKTDWRWLDARSDSPWYPGVVRLFRQQTMGDWAGVVAKVKAALEQRVWANVR
ncbi:MAG: tetratricopeptide repeat protein [Propionivibrio sp.]